MAVNMCDVQYYQARPPYVSLISTPSPTHLLFNEDNSSLFMHLVCHYLNVSHKLSCSLLSSPLLAMGSMNLRSVESMPSNKLPQMEWDHLSIFTTMYHLRSTGHMVPTLIGRSPLSIFCHRWSRVPGTNLILELTSLVSLWRKWIVQWCLWYNGSCHLIFGIKELGVCFSAHLNSQMHLTSFWILKPK